MAYFKRYAISVTTAGDASATGYTDEPVNGYIHSIQYVKTDFADGVDFDVTGEVSGIEVLNQDNVNASTVVYPRVQVQSTTGTASTYDGTRAVQDKIVIANERLKWVVASGGAAKTGTLYIIVGG
jgi:hypothetical protein